MDIKDAQRIGLGLRTPYTDDCHFTGQHIKDGYDWLISEHDRLTSALTSAKEERDAARNNFDALVCDWKKGPIAEEYLARAEAAESALTSERKETERLRGALQQISPNGWPLEMRSITLAALQSRQGEE